VLATKVHGKMGEGVNDLGNSRKHIIDQCEQSLRRLQTDYIDLYWMHFLDPFTPIEETMRALDDLVRTGKVRYIGFSDTPAWVCARAQTMAEWRDWSPLVALQIEYSLIERTVEADLIPMAMQLGMGVTPWSPLKYGVLSGKYTRENRSQAEGRGTGESMGKHLTERTFGIIDALRAIEKETGATVAQVALAWVQGRPGVASTIIGARTMDQLLDNLGALDVELTPGHVATLDELSRPALPFPHEFLRGALNIALGGTTVNGVASEPWALAPKSDADRH